MGNLFDQIGGERLDQVDSTAGEDADTNDEGCDEPVLKPADVQEWARSIIDQQVEHAHEAVKEAASQPSVETP